MLIKVFSDCHGYLPNIDEKFDLILIAGDITPAEWGFSYRSIQWEWVSKELKQWIDNLPYNDENSKVFIVPGNHDKIFEGLTNSERIELEEILGNRVELLIHEERLFKLNDRSIRIFGTPYCKIFGSWSFMYHDSFLEKSFLEIPKNIDILVTHDSPNLNNLGTITQGRQIGKNAGNDILAKRVLEVKPKYLFSGHIHSGNHKFEEYEGIKMANVAYVNEYYQPVNDVLTIEI